MVSLICQQCGKRFEVYPYREKSARFCSRSCGSSFTRNRWKGGRTVKPNGYIMVNVDGKYVYEHRHLMAQRVGRPLERDEAVHHINGRRGDNRPENLCLINKKEHDSMESKRRREEDPTSFFSRSEKRCGAPRLGRKAKGKLCRRWRPCSYHGRG